MVQLLFNFLFDEHVEFRFFYHLILPFWSFKVIADFHDILEKLLTEFTSDIILDELW